MNFAQGIGPWQSGVQRADQLAGFRADEYSVRCVLMRRRLVALKNDACGGGGGGGGGVATSFARADEWRAKLSRDAPMAAEGGSGRSGGAGGRRAPPTTRRPHPQQRLRVGSWRQKNQQETHGGDT